ncbi:MAG: hypothetical protein IT561_03280 [Alphaproteobacteria bacterium]|nr:hypothetical protein [Alphaproteobacteria bacterium]
MTEEQIRAELEALRQEIAALRGTRPDSPAAAGEAAASCAEGIGAGLGDVAKFLHAACDRVQETTTAHPLPAVLGSLAIGFLLGRLLSR